MLQIVTGNFLLQISIWFSVLIWRYKLGVDLVTSIVYGSSSYLPEHSPVVERASSVWSCLSCPDTSTAPHLTRCTIGLRTQQVNISQKCPHVITCTCICRVLSTRITKSSFKRKKRKKIYLIFILIFVFTVSPFHLRLGERNEQRSGKALPTQEKGLRTIYDMRCGFRLIVAILPCGIFA